MIEALRTSWCWGSAGRRSGPSRCAPRSCHRRGTRGRGGARRAAPASRARQRRSRHDRRATRPARPRDDVVHRDVEVRRHGGDDGAVPRRSRQARSRGSSPRHHFVFVTDPEKGALRRIARDEGFPRSAVPPNVGGRFSVLSPVGVLPAALIGIDVAGLLAGAADMRQRCAGQRSGQPTRLARSPCCSGSPTRSSGVRATCSCRTADGLRDIADWFVQLWAESLGKITGNGTARGSRRPLRRWCDRPAQPGAAVHGRAARQDRHVRRGRRRARETSRSRRSTPTSRSSRTSAVTHSASCWRSSSGRPQVRWRARGRLNMTISLDRLDAWHLGGLFMLLEIATALCR